MAVMYTVEVTCVSQVGHGMSRSPKHASVMAWRAITKKLGALPAPFQSPFEIRMFLGSRQIFPKPERCTHRLRAIKGRNKTA